MNIYHINKALRTRGFSIYKIETPLNYSDVILELEENIIKRKKVINDVQLNNILNDGEKEIIQLKKASENKEISQDVISSMNTLILTRQHQLRGINASFNEAKKDILNWENEIKNLKIERDIVLHITDKQILDFIQKNKV